MTLKEVDARRKALLLNSGATLLGVAWQYFTTRGRGGVLVPPEFMAPGDRPEFRALLFFRLADFEGDQRDHVFYRSVAGYDPEVEAVVAFLGEDNLTVEQVVTFAVTGLTGREAAMQTHIGAGN